MSDNKDYTELGLEDLLIEEKKIKKQEITAAVFVGILVGIMVYGIVKNGFGFLYVAIPLVLISVIAKNSQRLKEKLKAVQAEIELKRD